MRPISPSIDPQAHRAAIDALEAQRAAYRRFAHQAEAQQGALATGDLVTVSAFTDTAALDVSELHEGTRKVRALVDSAASSAGSDDQMRDLEHRMADMMREARTAETAIHNLSTQLEAWRDAYGKQLAELGITPGGDSSSTTPEAPAVPAPSRGGYGHPVSSRPLARILDRKG